MSKQNQATDTTTATITTVPSGSIILWHGDHTNVPSGWVICDGNNATPDLRDKFVMGGGGTEAPGLSGAADQHAHNFSISSTFTTTAAGTHNHEMPSSWYIKNFDPGGWGGVSAGSIENTKDSGLHSHTVAVSFQNEPTTNNTGLKPSWFALLYIMKS